MRALPNARSIPRKCAGGLHDGVAVAIHPGKSRGGVRGAVFEAQSVDHDFATVVELNASPIPADLFCGELTGADFVVHPDFARHGDGFVFEREGARCFEAWKGEVPACCCGGVPFAGDAIFAEDDEGFNGFEGKGEGGLIPDMGVECDLVQGWVTQHQLEIAHVEGKCVCGGGSVPAGAGEAFGVQKLTRERVEQGGMNEEKLIFFEAAFGCVYRLGWGLSAFSKNGCLEAEAFLVRAEEVACEIPPFQLESGMAAMIAWESEMMAWLRDLETILREPRELWKEGRI